MLIKVSLPLILLLIAIFGADAHYPLTQWPMYAQVGMNAPAKDIKMREYTIYYSDDTRLVHQGIIYDRWDDLNLFNRLEDEEPTTQAHAAEEIVRGVERHNKNITLDGAVPVKLEVRQLVWPVDLVRPPYVNTDAPPVSRTLSAAYTFEE